MAKKNCSNAHPNRPTWIQAATLGARGATVPEPVSRGVLALTRTVALVRGHRAERRLANYAFASRASAARFHERGPEESFAGLVVNLKGFTVSDLEVRTSDFGTAKRARTIERLHGHL